MMDLYVLGILWSIGSPIEDKYPYFILRHHDQYFLGVVRAWARYSPRLRGLALPRIDKIFAYLNNIWEEVFCGKSQFVIVPRMFQMRNDNK